MKGETKMYDVEITVINLNGDPVELKGTIDFSYKSGDYGNGYHMGVYGLGEAFGIGCYDIRYETEFDPKEKILWIMKFLNNDYGDRIKKISIEEVEKEPV